MMRPCWDISSFDEHGKPVDIEVKSSVGKSINQLIMTRNEWEAAKKHISYYFIYLVAGVNEKGARHIEIVQDPYGLQLKGVIEINIASYQIML